MIIITELFQNMTKDDNKSLSMASNSVKTEQLELEVFKHYCYTLSYPFSKAGYVIIGENKIILQFPEKNENLKNEYLIYFDFHFFINNQLKFFNKWLPCYSVNDFYVLNNMIYKVYCEFFKCLYYNNYTYELEMSNNKFYENVESKIENKYFSMSCFESATTTSIELHLKKYEYNSCLPEINDIIHIQIFIGENLILCSQRDFKNMPVLYVYYIFLYFFQKLLQY